MNIKEFLKRLETDERWRLTLRIAEGKGFQKSARLRDFHLSVAEQAVLGKWGGVTEQAIGMPVLEKLSGYSPAEEKLVRVSARPLRTKLREYFEEEGADEEMVLESPKGSYVAQFRPRKTKAIGNRPNWQARAVAGFVLSALLAIGLGVALWLGRQESRTPWEKHLNWRKTRPFW